MATSNTEHPDYAELCREAGITADSAHRIVGATPEADKVVVEISGDLTFDMLSKAAVLMGTRDINIECDLGCESDSSHNTSLVFTGVKVS